MIWSIYPKIILLIFMFMSAVFLLAQRLKNNAIVDVFWGLGFIAISLFLQVTTNAFVDRQYVFLVKHLVNFCVIIWGFRLAMHIFIRNAGQGEDWRYVNFRKNWAKSNIPQSLGAFLQVFMLQGLFMFIVALPVIHVNTGFQSMNAITFLGLLAWLTGFFFEAVGDYQLMQFKKNPAHKGKKMQSGLWKYTRHPNYFGEMMMWWGIWMMTINIFAPLQTLIGLLSPITITWLLTKVSGVPMLEKKYKDDTEYQEYVKKTPPFFPKFW